jgi:hypothetical protein
VLVRRGSRAAADASRWRGLPQGHVIRRKTVEAAAATFAINLVSVEAKLPGDLDAAFQSMTRQRVDCVIVLGEPMFFESAGELLRWRGSAEQRADTAA